MRQPSPCVRALCETGVLFHMSHFKLHFTLRTSHCTLHTPLHTSHSTLHTFAGCFVRSCCADVVQEHDLRTTPAQCNAKQTLSSHFTLRSSHFTLALHTCTSHSTLHLSNHVSSSHLISALLISSRLFPHVN